MPGFGLVANRATMSEKNITAIRTALNQLDPGGADKELLATWGENIRHGAIVALEHDYDLVRRLKGDRAIPTANKE